MALGRRRGQGKGIGVRHGTGVFNGDSEARVHLSSHPTSASAARRFVRGVLETWKCGDPDSVLICTDELVTNAIIHVSSDIDVVVRRAGDNIRVEVHDDSPRPPLRRVHAMDADSGRGLRVVEALCARWGVDAKPAGKAVWFEVPALSYSS